MSAEDAQRDQAPGFERVDALTGDLLHADGLHLVDALEDRIERGRVAGLEHFAAGGDRDVDDTTGSGTLPLATWMP